MRTPRLAPVHVVEGSRTSSVDHAIRDVIRQNVQTIHHTVIEGAGHMIPLTHPEPLTHALVAGIQRSGAITTRSA